MAVKTTRITIETESLMIVRRGKTIVTWSPVCCAEAEAMTLEGDSLGEGIPSALFSRLARSRQAPFWNPDSGPTQICLLPRSSMCLESEDAGRLPDPRPAVSKAGEGTTALPFDGGAIGAGLYCGKVAHRWDLPVMTIRQAAAFHAAINATTTDHTEKGRSTYEPV